MTSFGGKQQTLGLLQSIVRCHATVFVQYQNAVKRLPNARLHDPISYYSKTLAELFVKIDGHHLIVGAGLITAFMGLIGRHSLVDQGAQRLTAHRGGIINKLQFRCGANIQLFGQT